MRASLRTADRPSAGRARGPPFRAADMIIHCGAWTRAYDDPMAASQRKAVAALLAALVATTMGCTATQPPPPNPPPPLALPWQEVSLPAAPAGERNVLRAAAVCDGHWYLVGAYGGAADATRPAAWRSRDGVAWSAMPVSAYSYYGVRSELSTAACRNGRLVTLGGKPGGAHGNPRISSYHVVTDSDGVEILTEVGASFELYGGPRANNVGRMAAGPQGYLIVGNRTAGAAVWLSPDGSAFEILEGVPVLASDADRVTWAADAAALDGDWIVVGGAVAAGRTDRDVYAWRSTDGRTWTTMPTESDPAAYDELSVVAEQGGTLVGIGSHGGAFQAWRLASDGWRLAGAFGTTRASATNGRRTAVIATDLAAAGDQLLGMVILGGEHHLWHSPDGGLAWQPVTSPTPMPAGPQRGAAIVGIDGATGQFLLAVDDGADSRVFVAAL
jgi:hypothetical protein